MTRKVRYIDYSRHYGKMRTEVLGIVDEVLSRGDLMMRQQLRDFEANLAEFVGTRHAIGTGNCTDALHLSMRAAGLRAGDEVITVSHTFVATVAAIHHAGCVPVLVDIGEDHNVDVDQIEAAITSRTKAIVPVHLNGRVSAMDSIMDIAERHGLIVIEDSAQALGASFRGVKGGAFGLAGCFSFYPAKLLGAFGDAGAVVTSDSAFAERLRSLRDHGRTATGELAGWSFNSRLDNLHAAILDFKLKRLPEWLERRREIARLYDERLCGLEQLKIPVPPSTFGERFDVFQNYEIEAENRDGLKQHLHDAGVETMLPWGGKGVHQFPALGLGHFSLPRTERMFRKALMLPMHCELSDEDVDYVAQQVADFYGSPRRDAGALEAALAC